MKTQNLLKYKNKFAGHAGTFIKYKQDNVIVTGKVFFNNGESSKNNQKSPKNNVVEHFFQVINVV